MLEKTMRVNQLFDFYHPLITNKQKLYVELYYHEDYSLGEIADLSNVSRQAVYDNIKRTEKLFETYESKLKLLEKFQCRLELLNELEEIIIPNKNIGSAKDKIKQLRKLD